MNRGTKKLSEKTNDTTEELDPISADVGVLPDMEDVLLSELADDPVPSAEEAVDDRHGKRKAMKVAKAAGPRTPGKAKAPTTKASKPGPRPPAVGAGDPSGAGQRRSLRSILADSEARVPSRVLPEVRLGTDPVRIGVFTDDVEQVELHYEEDDAVRGYFRCPGAGCPHCKLRVRRDSVFLLPVLMVATRQVGVLRVSSAEGPGRLLSLLRPHLDDPDISTKMLEIARHGSRYTVVAHAVRPGLDLGKSAVDAYVTDVEQGAVSLADTFAMYSVSELRGIPAIANQLEVLEAIDASPRVPVKPKASAKPATTGKKTGRN